jgi:hypothetical protein
MDFDSYARRLWAGRADAYQHGFARLTVHLVGALLDAAGAAVARGARVTAIDAEPSMAEAAARNVPAWTCGLPCCRTCRCPPPGSTR